MQSAATGPGGSANLKDGTVSQNAGKGVNVAGDLTINGGRLCGNRGGDLVAGGAQNLTDVVYGEECSTDADGVPDEEEDAAPNNGDGNNDGTPDSQQDNVTSLRDESGENVVTIAAPAGAPLQQVQAMADPSGGNVPQGIAFPVGFISFTTQVSPGGAITIDVFLPSGTSVNAYYKYGPEPGNNTPHFYHFTFDGTTGAEVQGNKIVLHFVDGQRGDQDLTANGVITDPGAPTVASVSRSPSLIGLTAFGLAVDSGVILPADLRLPTGARLATWDVANAKYLVDSEVTQLRPGQGLWLKAPTATVVELVGQPATQAFEVALKSGWSLISVPFTSAVSWDLQALKVRQGAQEQTLAAAQQAGVMEDFAWGFEQNATDPNSGQYALVCDGSVIAAVRTQLEPFQAYWVKASEDCSLVAPPPSAAAALSTRQRRPAGRDHWTITLAAACEGARDSVVVGVSPTGGADRPATSRSPSHLRRRNHQASSCSWCLPTEP